MKILFFLLLVLLFFGLSDSFAEPELKRQVTEKYMAVELSHYLIENKVNWKFPERELSGHLDIGRSAPWTLCTELVHPDDQTFYLSVTNLDDHSMSDVKYHESLPFDCAFFVYPPKIITDLDNFIVHGDKPHEWIRDCWTFDYTQDFFTGENPYRYTSPYHRDYVMCKTAIDLNLYTTDLEKLGKNLDWNHYAEEITSEYLYNWNFGEYDAFPETLRYQTFVSSRDSLPPKMHAAVTFDFADNGTLKTFDGRFAINPLYSPALYLEWENGFAPERIMDERCGADTESIDGVCQVVKVDTVGSDAPFFGIFVYLDDLISWIFGNLWNSSDEKQDFVDEEIDGYAIDYGGKVEHLPFADVCTNEMKIILLTHSNIASTDKEFVIEDVGLPFGMIEEDFERCILETSFTKERSAMMSMENG